MTESNPTFGKNSDESNSESIFTDTNPKISSDSFEAINIEEQYKEKLDAMTTIILQHVQKETNTLFVDKVNAMQAQLNENLFQLTTHTSKMQNEMSDFLSTMRKGTMDTKNVCKGMIINIKKGEIWN